MSNNLGSFNSNSFAAKQYVMPDPTLIGKLKGEKDGINQGDGGTRPTDGFVMPDPVKDLTAEQKAKLKDLQGKMDDLQKQLSASQEKFKGLQAQYTNAITSAKIDGIKTEADIPKKAAGLKESIAFCNKEIERLELKDEKNGKRKLNPKNQKALDGWKDKLDAKQNELDKCEQLSGKLKGLNTAMDVCKKESATISAKQNEIFAIIKKEFGLRGQVSPDPKLSGLLQGLLTNK